MAASSAVPEYRLRLPYVPRAIFKPYHARQQRWAVIVRFGRRHGRAISRRQQQRGGHSVLVIGMEKGPRWRGDRHPIGTPCWQGSTVTSGNDREPRQGCWWWRRSGRSVGPISFRASRPRRSAGRTKTARIWTYVRDERPWLGPDPPAACYRFTCNRKGEHPAAHLAEFQGVLQVDGYSGFKSLLAGRPPDRIKLAFCWAHLPETFLRAPSGHRLAAGGGGAAPDRRALPDRGRGPRPPRRGAAYGPAGA